MKGLVRAAVMIFAVIGVAYVVMLVGGSYLVSRRCSTYPVAVVPSPRGTWQAHYEQEVCSDDRRLRAVVWIGDPGSFGRRRWSAFRAPAPVQAPLPPDNQPVALTLTWLTDSHLQITHPAGLALEHDEGEREGVKVTYRAR